MAFLTAIDNLTAMPPGLYFCIVRKLQTINIECKMKVRKINKIEQKIGELLENRALALYRVSVNERSTGTNFARPRTTIQESPPLPKIFLSARIKYYFIVKSCYWVLHLIIRSVPPHRQKVEARCLGQRHVRPTFYIHSV